MRNVGAAAAADHRDPVLDDKALEPLRQFGRPERVTGMAGDQLGQTGIGLDRDPPRPVLAQPFDVLGHLARAGRTVEPDHRHVERVDDGRSRGDVGPDQQCPGGFDRDLNQDRRVLVRGLARPLGAVDRRLDLQRVLAGLDDDGVDPALDQPGALHRQRVFEILIADMAERGQAGPRPDRAQHKPGAPVMGELGDGLAGDLGGAAIERERAVGEAELAEGDRRAAKAVGLHRVAAGLEIAAVDLADQVGAAVADDLGAVFLAEKVALDVEVARLHLGSHGAVAQDDMVGEVVEEMSHRDRYIAAKPLSAALRGRGRDPRRRRGRVRWPGNGARIDGKAPLTLPSPPASGWRGRICRENPDMRADLARVRITVRPPRRAFWRARRAGGRSPRSDRRG